MGMMASSDDEILTINIASGTYSTSLTGEYFPIVMYPNYNLLGAGVENTTIDVEGQGKALKLEFSYNNDISDLTITGASVSFSDPAFDSEKGGGVYVNSSTATFNNLIIDSNVGAVSYTHLRAHET